MNPFITQHPSLWPMNSFAAKSIISRTLVVIAAFLAYASTALADKSLIVVGRVIKIVNGDTIDVQLRSGPIRIRFHGVDAPERAQDHGKGPPRAEDFGASADASAPWVYRRFKKTNPAADQPPETTATCVAAIGKPYPPAR